MTQTAIVVATGKLLLHSTCYIQSEWPSNGR